MPIIDRYLLAECVKTWLGVIGVLAVLTLGAGFARFIADAAAGELPAETVLAVAGFSALENLEIVLPVSVLLAVMLTVGRLCRDNEMAALAAGGVGLARLYRPFGGFALVLAGLAAWLSLSVTPQAERSMERLRVEEGGLLLQAVEAGRFTVFGEGRGVFYAASADADGMHDVFIRLRGTAGEEDEIPGAETVVIAERALYERDEDSGRQILILRDGRRYEGAPGRADYRITRFAEHGLWLSPPRPELDADIDEAPTAELLARSDTAARAELQQRLSTPVSLLLLALLAVPLGYLPPRSGRYGRLVVGIVAYVVYANMLRLGEVWMLQGRLPAALGLWWVHALALLAVFALVAYRRNGRLRLPFLS